MFNKIWRVTVHAATAGWAQGILYSYFEIRLEQLAMARECNAARQRLVEE